MSSFFESCSQQSQFMTQVISLTPLTCQANVTSLSPHNHKNIETKRCLFRYINTSTLTKYASQESQSLKSEGTTKSMTLNHSQVCKYKSIKQKKSLIRYEDYQNDFSVQNPTVIKEEFEDYSKHINTQSQTESVPIQNQQPLPKKKRINKTIIKKQKMLEEPIVKDLLEKYKNIKDQNSLKNIKEAFIRHVNSNLSEDLKNHYSQLMGGNLHFGQIKKKINFSLKENSTNNKCIKFMCKSNQVSPIFLHFLSHVEEYWLAESKVQQKETCKQIVAFLIKLIDNIQFVDLIEHYHTKI